MADTVKLAATSSRLQSNNAGVLNFKPALPGIDNQRILAVLEKAVERLELLRVMNYETATDAATVGALAAAASSDASGTNAAMHAESLLKKSKTNTTNGRGVGDILDEQRALEQRYEALLKATQRDHQNPREPAMDAECYSHVKDEEREALKKELQKVSQQLKDQSRLLCRQLKENPNDANNWKKVVTERDELIKILMSCITELQSTAQMSADAAVHTASAASKGMGGQGNVLASYEAFARKVLDEQSASLWADALVKKEKETNQNVKQLQNEVKLERALKEQELEECETKLMGLKTQLRELKKTMKARADKLRAETEAATEAQEGDANEQQRVLNNAIGSTLGAIDSEQTVHVEMQSHIQKKQRALEELYAKRTREINEKQDERERMKSDLQTDCNTKRADIDRKEALKEESLEAKAARDRERMEKAQLKKDSEARTNAKYDATTKLQAALKAMITRANLVALKKKAAKKEASSRSSCPCCQCRRKRPS